MKGTTHSAAEDSDRELVLHHLLWKRALERPDVHAARRTGIRLGRLDLVP